MLFLKPNKKNNKLNKSAIKKAGREQRKKHDVESIIQILKKQQARHTPKKEKGLKTPVEKKIGSKNNIDKDEKNLKNQLKNEEKFEPLVKEVMDDIRKDKKRELKKAMIYNEIFNVKKWNK